MSLVERLKARDEEAYEQIITDYRNLFLYIIKQYIKNDEDCFDCLQEVYLKIYLNIDKCNVSDKNLKPWIVKLARNCIIDYLRTLERRYEHYELNNDIVDRFSANTLETNQSLLLEELRVYLGDADFEILVYYKIMHFTYKEIAEILDLPPYTARRKMLKIYDKAVNFFNIKEDNYEEE